MHKGIRVAVVIPAVRADWRLGRLIQSLPKMVDDVVVVDDGPDAIHEIESGVLVVKHLRNRGVGAAIMTGWNTAASIGADVAVVMAADGQMDPTELPRLLEPIVRGEADLVKGDRLSHPACPKAMPLTRRIGNYCLTFLTRLAALRWAIMDSQCGYTALRMDVLHRLPLDWLYTRYGFPNDLLVAASGAGIRVSQVVTTPVYDGEPSGIRPVIAALTYPWILMRSPLLHIVTRWRRRKQ